MSRYCIIIKGDVPDRTCQECEEKQCSYCYCLVVGSRTFNNYELMRAKLDEILNGRKDVVIVSGGANGADSLAEKYASERGYAMAIFRAEWNKYGKSAGYKRNAKMHEYISRFEERICVAFWDGISRGTQHNFSLAERYGTRLEVVRF